MTISIQALPAWLRNLNASFRDNVNDHMRDAVEAGAFSAVEGTPVDTGLHRSNWSGSPGAPPPDVERGPYAPGSKLGRGETANLAATLAPIYAAAARWKAADGSVFYLSNSAKNIQDLDDGKSRQGSNFSDAAVASALNLISTKRFI